MMLIPSDIMLPCAVTLPGGLKLKMRGRLFSSGKLLAAYYSCAPDSNSLQLGIAMIWSKHFWDTALWDFKKSDMIASLMLSYQCQCHCGAEAG